MTFDVIPWTKVRDTLLRQCDIDGDRIMPITANLCHPAVFEDYGDLLRTADLLFIDGPKDGHFEYKLMDYLRVCGLREGAFLVFDDIRLWNMLDFWRRLDLPKLDLTGFGHFTGTGIAQWRCQ